MRIILADDHAMFREGLRPFLSRLAPQVEVADFGSLDAVLEHIRSGCGTPDLVILDLHMPGMSGAADVALVRAELPAVPVVILSGHVDRPDVLDAIAAGASGYVSKRLSGASLLAALRIVLSGERYVPNSIMENGALPLVPCGALPRGQEGLTRRETEILNLLKEGLPNRQIGDRLSVTEVTVKSHLCSIFRKMGVTNRVQAIQRFSENLQG